MLTFYSAEAAVKSYTVDRATMYMVSDPFDNTTYWARDPSACGRDTPNAITCVWSVRISWRYGLIREETGLVQAVKRNNGRIDLVPVREVRHRNP